MRENTRRLVVLLATLMAVAITARLGVWQLDRAAQKQALQASLDERSALPPLPQQALARSEADVAGQVHRAVTVSGRWLPAFEVWLENRQQQGQPGFVLLMPLELAPGDVVLVQRGWAPRDLRDRLRVPQVPTPTDEVTLTGRIAPPPARLLDFGDPGQGRIRQNLALGAYAKETGLVLRPLTLLQSPDPAAADGLGRDWGRPAVDVDKHHGYAFQWFALATLLSGLYVWFQIRRPRLRRR